MKRRDFLSSFAMGVGLVVSFCTSAIYGLKYLLPIKRRKKKIDVLIAKVDELKPGETLNFLDENGRKAILINVDGKIKAFSRICTHLGCEVEWLPDEKIFFCPCHLGKYDENGKNIAGPPPRPLDQFKVTIKDNYIYVTFNV